MSVVLEALAVRVRYKDRVVLDVPHLTLHEGEVLALIGPNGAGKTTLLRVLAALHAPSEGLLRYRGRPVGPRDRDAYRRRLAVVLHPPPLLDLSVYHNVALGLYLRGWRGQRVRRRVHHWLERFHIAHLASRRALHLSAGERQRVALARALVIEPDLLFLDEPFSGLDAPTRERLVVDVQANVRATGTTTCFVTHNREDALALGDRVAVLMDGRIRQVGTPEEVFLRPVDLDVARFVGMENLLPARAVDHGPITRVTCLPDALTLYSLTAPAGPDVYAGIRPEYVRLGESPPPSAGVARFQARVETVMPLGARVRVHLRHGSTRLVALLDYAQWRENACEPGATVSVTISPEHVHLLPRVPS